MLKGLYAHLSPPGKLLLLTILVLSFLLFSTLIGILVLVPFYGPEVINLLSSPDFNNASTVSALKVLQIINSAGGLLLPAAIYLWLCMPEEAEPFGLAKPVVSLSVILSFILIILAQPLIGWANELNSYLSLPEWLSAIEEWMKDAESKGELVTESFLATTSVSGLIVNIFMIAIMPAVAEEVLFRGALTTLFKDWSKSTLLAVFVSSFIFAAIHMQFYGFLPRFLLGIVLGYLYVWSGSLWLPVVAHFANNFLSVIIEFLFRNGYMSTNAENFGMDNAGWITAASAIAVTGILYYIHKLTVTKEEKDIVPG